jgi:hypothetical protein
MKTLWLATFAADYEECGCGCPEVVFETEDAAISYFEENTSDFTWDQKKVGNVSFGYYMTYDHGDPEPYRMNVTIGPIDLISEG